MSLLNSLAYSPRFNGIYSMYRSQYAQLTQKAGPSPKKQGEALADGNWVDEVDKYAFRNGKFRVIFNPSKLNYGGTKAIIGQDQPNISDDSSTRHSDSVVLLTGRDLNQYMDGQPLSPFAKPIEYGAPHALEANPFQLSLN